MNTHSTTATPATPRRNLWTGAALVIAGVVIGFLASACGNGISSKPGAGLGVPQAQAEPAKAAAVKWEYKAVDMESVKKTPGGGTMENYSLKLTDEGKDGWELFAWQYPMAIYRRAK